MFVVQCPKCKKQAKSFVDYAGLRGKCPHCGKTIRIVAQEGLAPADELPTLAPRAGSVHRGRRRRAHLPDTSPSAIVTAVLAAGATWLFFYAGYRVFPDSSSNTSWAILMSCGRIGIVEVFLALWGLLLVSSKSRLWRRQRRSLQWKVLPDRFSGDARIRPEDVEACTIHINGLSKHPRRSILLNRVLLALDHLRLSRDVQEVRGALTGQSAIDANLLDSSYTVMRFLIWVLPIVGFIGTVIGIGYAVSEFASFIPEVSDVEKAMDSLREGLGKVTTGLGTAFNSTLVALCLVAPLMLLTSALRKLEERLLAEVDYFSNHQFLACMTVTEAVGENEPVPAGDE